MKQAELQLKQGELQRKATKDAADVAIDQERLDLDKQKAIISATNEAARIDATVNQADQKADIDAAKTLLNMTKTEVETQRTRAEAHRDASEAYRDDREDR